MKNRMLIGEKALEYIRKNPMTIIRVSDKNSMSNLVQNYSGVKGLNLDITELKDNARLLLLKFAEEAEDLTCMSVQDIQDPILLSRFKVEKSSTLKVVECTNMNLTEFLEIYKSLKEDVKDGKMTEYEIKKQVMENCPIFYTLPKNKFMDVLTESY